MEWRRVTASEPAYGQNVIVLVGGDVCRGERTKDAWYTNSFLHDGDDDDIKFWIPMPAEPEGGEE